ncbi:MAG: thiol-disulfide isomerase/thioredoxin [Paraglaciecola sp.]|jgi:thiol-disulfide isomerase/thioredoxin
MTLLKKSLFMVLSILALGAGVLAFNAQRPDFTTVDGRDHQWQDLQGKWVVVNYFAQWCAPCLREIPQLNAFYQQNNPQIKMFAISFDPASAQELTDMQQKFDIQFPLIAKVQGPLPMLKPKSLPATFLIAPDGTVAKKLLGEQSAESLNQAIAYLEGLHSSL